MRWRSLRACTDGTVALEQGQGVHWGGEGAGLMGGGSDRPRQRDAAAAVPGYLRHTETSRPKRSSRHERSYACSEGGKLWRLLKLAMGPPGFS